MKIELWFFIHVISVVLFFLFGTELHTTYFEFSYFLSTKYLKNILSRAGSGQSPARNLARGPLFLSGPTQPGPHFCRPVVARGNILLARMARI